MGKKFELRIDHNGLRYMFEHRTLNAKKKRWIEFFGEYEFEIKHIKGKENKFVDALSIRVHIMHATTISMHRLYLKRKNLDVFVLDQHYLQVKQILSQEYV
jgi:hypothetical protein